MTNKEIRGLLEIITSLWRRDTAEEIPDADEPVYSGGPIEVKIGKKSSVIFEPHPLSDSYGQLDESMIREVWKKAPSAMELSFLYSQLTPEQREQWHSEEPFFVTNESIKMSSYGNSEPTIESPSNNVGFPQFKWPKPYDPNRIDQCYIQDWLLVSGYSGTGFPIMPKSKELKLEEEKDGGPVALLLKSKNKKELLEEKSFGSGSYWYYSGEWEGSIAFGQNPDKLDVTSPNHPGIMVCNGTRLKNAQVWLIKERNYSTEDEGKYVKLD